MVWSMQSSFEITECSFKNILAKLIQFIYNAHRYTHTYIKKTIHIQEHKQVNLLHSNSSSKGFLSKIKREVTPPKELTTNNQDVSANIKKTYIMDKELLIIPIVLEKELPELPKLLSLLFSMYKC